MEGVTKENNMSAHCSDGECMCIVCSGGGASLSKYKQYGMIAALFALALWALVAAVSGVQEFRYIGAGLPPANTISISGYGEVFSVADVASFSVSVVEEGETVEDAQEQATSKMNDVIAYLEDAGVEEKDIKTTNYSVSPQYRYPEVLCREGFCPPRERELTGFEVNQTLSVKVRETDEAGEILSEVGSRGVSYVSGLSFTIDDPDQLQAQARAEAIADAKEKARVLARDLGVRLVRVVNFYEEGSPHSFARAAFDAGGVAFSEAASAAPKLPVGENKITSDVNITYEIR